MTKTLKLRKASTTLKKQTSKTFLRHFKIHSIKKIKKHFNSEEIFTFREFKETEVIKTIKKLRKDKANTLKDIPVKIMVNSVHIYSQMLTNICNDYVKSGNFPDISKYVDITPAFRKGDKTNYRPISTLSNFSKVFQKLIYAQINSFMGPKLSKYEAGFRSKYNTQHALKTIENWRAVLNKGNKVDTILMDLFKALNNLNHTLLLFKLKAYGFNKNILTFIQNYFTNRH